MIVRGKPTFWELLYLSSVVQRILPQLIAVVCLSLLLVVLHRRGWTQIPTIPTVGLSVIGAALSILAAFRNSASYERWWEARKVAGLLVVEARNLSRQAQSYIAAAPGDELSRRISLRCIAFIQVTRDFLRDRPAGEDTAPYLSPEERAVLASSRNRSSRLLAAFSADIAGAVAAGRVLPQMVGAPEAAGVAPIPGYSMAQSSQGTPLTR